MGANQRLRDAIRQSGLSNHELAERLGIDPKTVARWITTGRVPLQAQRREQTAALLGMPVAVLWPSVAGVMDGLDELVGVYRTRTEVAPGTIRSLLDGATGHIDVLAYAALWLWDAVPSFADLLAAKLHDGVGVRVCLGDPDGNAVRRRGDEEAIGDRMAARCRLSATYAAAALGRDPAVLRCSDATLYASVTRFDDDLLVNTHLWGNAAGDSPVFHYRWRGDKGIAANVMRSFERVWERAQPVPGG